MRTDFSKETLGPPQMTLLPPPVQERHTIRPAPALGTSLFRQNSHLSIKSEAFLPAATRGKKMFTDWEIHGSWIKSDFQTPKSILIKILIADAGNSVAVQWLGGSPAVKNLPAAQETWVQSLGWKDPLEEGMETHSSILAWRIHGKRSLAGYSPWGRKESDMTEAT